MLRQALWLAYRLAKEAYGFPTLAEVFDLLDREAAGKVWALAQKGSSQLWAARNQFFLLQDGRMKQLNPKEARKFYNGAEIQAPVSGLPAHVAQALDLGQAVITMPWKLYRELVNHLDGLAYWGEGEEGYVPDWVHPALKVVRNPKVGN